MPSVISRYFKQLIIDSENAPVYNYYFYYRDGISDEEKIQVKQLIEELYIYSEIDETEKYIHLNMDKSK